MKITIETNKDNKDYLNLNRLSLIALFLSSGSAIPPRIEIMANRCYKALLEYEKKFKNAFVEKITIRKDSELGYYLLNTNDFELINEDYNISYEKVFNAYAIASFEENSYESKIYPLFKKRVCGTVDELKNVYDEDILNYIITNDDFLTYLEKYDNSYVPKRYVVYESDKYNYKLLTDEKIKTLK